MEDIQVIEVGDNIFTEVENDEDSFDDLFNQNYPIYPTYTPLHHKWILYYLGPLDKWGEEDNLAKIRSVEDFWSIYNNIKTVDQLLTNSSYMIFRENIIPCWSNEQHIGGGRWVLSYSKKEEWLNVLLLLIGGTINAIGAIYAKKMIVKKRKWKNINVVTVWLSNLPEDQCLAVGKQLKTVYTKEIYYVKHEDCKGKNKYLMNAKKTHKI